MQSRDYKGIVKTGFTPFIEKWVKFTLPIDLYKTPSSHFIDKWGWVVLFLMIVPDLYRKLPPSRSHAH